MEKQAAGKAKNHGKLNVYSRERRRQWRGLLKLYKVCEEPPLWSMFGAGNRPSVYSLVALLSLLLVMLLASAAARGDQLEAVDLELVLAVDVSSSVDPFEARLQRQGYVYALSHPVIIDAVNSGRLGRIAVLYVEWAGQTHQRIVVDWQVIDDQASAQNFSARLAAQRISTAPYTSISSLIDFARAEIHSNRYQGRRAVIDISGDGPNSDGRLVRDARDDAVASRITINGLPVLSTRPGPGGTSPPSTFLNSYYIDHVIGGPGAFTMEVNEYKNFGTTLLKKLQREIEQAMPNLSSL